MGIDKLTQWGHRLAPVHYDKLLGGRVVIAPVSYTHLRAHETVLDLVCRLLLEKNKKSYCGYACTRE